MRQFISLLVFTALAACSVPPYVHKAGQYDRGTAGFGQPVSGISSVTICYSTYSATAGQVSKLALDECARFGESVRFIEQDYNICPITAPMAAVYACEGGSASEENSNVQGIPKGTLMNYDGIQFRY